MRNIKKSKVLRFGIGSGARNDIAAATSAQNEAQWSAARNFEGCLLDDALPPLPPPMEPPPPAAVVQYRGSSGSGGGLARGLTAALEVIVAEDEAMVTYF